MRTIRLRSVLIGVFVFGLLSLDPAIASADSRTDRLIELLTTSQNYRVRVQSALSLGRLASPDAVPALIASLDDEHPAVRAAAASSLGRIATPAARRALERMASDSSQPPEVAQTAGQALAKLQLRR